jgi:hypothetical protein
VSTQDNYGNSTTLAIRRAEGTEAAPTAVTTGLELGRLSFRGAYDVTGVGTFDSVGPYIRSVSTEGYTAVGNRGASLDFATIANGSGSPTVALTLGQDKSANFTGAVVATTASGIKTLQAATQDGIALLGRAGGTSSYSATITPATLTASRTVTVPDATGTMGLFVVLGSAPTPTTAGVPGQYGYYANYKYTWTGAATVVREVVETTW